MIGGAEVYAAALPLADRAVVTELEQPVEGDRFAPTLDDGWQPTSTDPAWLTSTTGLRYRVRTYIRDNSAGF